MAAVATAIDDLLCPISAEQPAGADLRWTPDWDRIKEARRADDDLQQGKWTKKERKSANWTQVKQLCEAALREKSKDLQIALWLTEASMKLHGFPALRDSFRLIRGLIVDYWDNGLYPPIEDGPEDRAGPLAWLNDKLMESVLAIPITAREDGGPDYSFIAFEESRRVGSEAGCHDVDGGVDPEKKREYDSALERGCVSAEMFERAVRETKRAAYEAFRSTFVETWDEYKQLEQVVDEKLGDVAPSMSACRAIFSTLDQAISDILEQKRKSEPDLGVDSGPLVPDASSEAEQTVIRLPLQLRGVGSSSSERGSWDRAEALIRAGQVDQGLAEMTRLAAAETTGRDRFQRRLTLAEICLASKRQRLARSILEGLSAEIEKHQLEQWESTELIGAVWTRLHQLYATNEGDSDRAAALYEKLCKLDPWQALMCAEK